MRSISAGSSPVCLATSLSECAARGAGNSSSTKPYASLPSAAASRMLRRGCARARAGGPRCGHGRRAAGVHSSPSRSRSGITPDAAQRFKRGGRHAGELGGLLRGSGDRRRSCGPRADNRAVRRGAGYSSRTEHEGGIVNYFVTGATGFIGRHLVAGAPEARRDHLRARPRGLARAARRADRRARDAEATGSWPCRAICRSRRWASRASTSEIDHFFHLAAIYDMEADEETSHKANVEGTRHAIEFANSHRRRPLPPHQLDRGGRQVSSGLFREDMFDEGQQLPHHYHRRSSSPRSSCASS